MERGKIRQFNLLFLEEGEEYFDDILIVLKKGKKEKMKHHNDIKGRLRLCSKSLVFEPFEIEDEVIKIPFRKLEYIKLNKYKNELLIKTVEIIKINTITHHNKTRCISQFTYEREHKKPVNLFKEEEEKGDYTFIKNIDNNNISEKIKHYEQRLQDFDKCLFLEQTNSTQHNILSSNHNMDIETNVFNKKGNTYNYGDIGKNDGSIADTTTNNINNYHDNNYNININPFVFLFCCENAIGMSKKLKHIYDIVVKIKIAMSIQEKQMEIMIKEKKSKNESNINNSSNFRKHGINDSDDEEINYGSNKEDGIGKGKEKGKEKGRERSTEIETRIGIDTGKGRKDLNLEKYIKSIADELTKNVRFDISSINMHEKIISNKMEGFWVFKLSPLLKIKGILNITDIYIYFQPNPNFTNKREKKWKIKNIVHVFKRIITMKPNSLEIIFRKEKKRKEQDGDGKRNNKKDKEDKENKENKEHEKGKVKEDAEIETKAETKAETETESAVETETERKYSSLYIEFNSFNERQMVINVLKKVKPEAFFIDDNKDFVYAVQKKWIHGYLSNYEYLDFLNSIGGRSRKDFSQYPVFPWILTNYKSSTINLEDIQNFRDLSKPIGCLNENRLNSLIEKMIDHEYFYGSHYSTLAYVVHFLIRLHPECQLKLQSGKFDTLARMFLSIESTFNTALNGNSSFIELIPEFFENDDRFLKNELNIITCEGNINDVILPKWCTTPKQFLTIMKQALESTYVNQHLHEWIDLIFGYKQKGKPAKDSFNLFHPLTYMHAILNEKMATGEEEEKEDEDKKDDNDDYELETETEKKRKEKRKKKKQQHDDNFDQQFNTNIKSLILSMPSKALQTQLHEFGQCPLQLFKERHPPKKCFENNDMRTYDSENKEKKYPNVLNKEKINIPWYYSEVINQTLKEEYIKKKKREKRLGKEKEKEKFKSKIKYDKRKTSPYRSSDNDTYDDDIYDEHSSNANRKRATNVHRMNNSESRTNDDYDDEEEEEETETETGEGNNIEEVGKNGYKKLEKQYDYFKKCKWMPYKNYNFSVGIKAVSNTEQSICFVNNNGYIKILNISDLLYERYFNTNSNNNHNNSNCIDNLVSLKITDDHLTCVNNVEENYVFGTSNGNIIVFNPKSILKKINKNFYSFTTPDDEAEEEEEEGHGQKERGREKGREREIEREKKHTNQKKNEKKSRKQEEPEEMEKLEEQASDHFFSDISDIASENSSSSLFSTVDEVFGETYEKEFDDHYDKIREEKKYHNTKHHNVKYNNAKYHNTKYQNKIKKKHVFFENSNTNHNIYNKMITKKVHHDTVTCLSAYDSFLISGSLDETIQIINIENNLEIVQTYDDFNSPVRYVQMRNKLALAQSDSFKLFDIRKPKKGVLSTNIKPLSQIKGFRSSSYANMNQENFQNWKHQNGLLLLQQQQQGQFNNKKKNRWNDFHSNFQKQFYDEQIIKINYNTPQCLFEKKMKKNSYFLYKEGKKTFNNIIYSNMINDYIIVCIDRNSNSYFYDIRNEKWINRFMQNKQKKKNEILAVASDKQQICTVDSSGDIILEQLNFWTSTNFYQKRKTVEGTGTDEQEQNDDEKENLGQEINGDSWKTNIFEKKSAISASYINFLNYKNEPDSLSNILLFTNRKGNLEIMKKKEL